MNDSEVTDPIDFLIHCSLREISLLENMNQNCLSKWIHDTDDDEYNEFDYNRSDSMTLNNETNTGVHQRNKYINTTDNSSKMDIDKTDTEFHFNLAETNLERTMLRTHMSRKFLENKLTSGSVNGNKSLSKNMDTESVVSKKQNNLNRDIGIGDSKSYKFQKTITKYGDFFNGKRSDLTAEVEASRNHLKMLGICLKNKKLGFEQKNFAIRDRCQVVCRNEKALTA